MLFVSPFRFTIPKITTTVKSKVYVQLLPWMKALQYIIRMSYLTTRFVFHRLLENSRTRTLEKQLRDFRVLTFIYNDFLLGLFQGLRCGFGRLHSQRLLVSLPN